MVDAKLILLLANHIGDLEVVREALDHANRACRNPGDRAENHAGPLSIPEQFELCQFWLRQRSERTMPTGRT